VQATCNAEPGVDALAYQSVQALLSECQTKRASVEVSSPGQHDSILTVAEYAAVEASKHMQTDSALFIVVPLVSPTRDKAQCPAAIDLTSLYQIANRCKQLVLTSFFKKFSGRFHP
jgi:hypothetical protein